MVEGVVLAGGKASRMRQNKMLLQYKGKPMIYHTIKSMFTYCNKITIVTGYYDLDYKEVLKEFQNVQILYNDEHDLGMFSSIKKAISQCKEDIVLIPGDYPLVKDLTYKRILDGDGQIRVPVYSGRRGHPIFISKHLFKDLLSEDVESNLKIWRDKHKVTYIEVDDGGVIRDIDTIVEYKQLIEERNEANED